MDFGTLKIIDYELKCFAHRRSAPLIGKEPRAKEPRFHIHWWPDLESNQGHKDFQSFALPTELSGLRERRSY